MKSFVSAGLQEAMKPAPSTECNSCSQGVVNSGQETVEVSKPEKEGTVATPPTEEKKEAVVVMQGPLGSVITEALNKTLNKRAMMGTVNIPGTTSALEDLNAVQANGQIVTPEQFASVSKAVGIVPQAGSETTVINALLDCASRVDDIEFLAVKVVDPNPSTDRISEKSVTVIHGADGTKGQRIAIESIQVIVKYKDAPQ